MEDKCTLARNKRKDGVGGVFGSKSGCFRGREEMRTKRVVEVDSDLRSEHRLERAREAAGAVQLTTEARVEPPVDVVKLAPSFLGGFDQDVEAPIAARLDDEGAHERLQVGFAVGVRARPRIHLDGLELLAQAQLPRRCLTSCITCGPGWRGPGGDWLQINCQPGRSIRRLDQHLRQGRDRPEPSGACAS